MVKIPILTEMLKVGMHFGHKKERSHPKARENIFAMRDRIYVIDLEKTRKKLKVALDFCTQTSAKGKTILFVGTKRQAKSAVKGAAEACNMPYVDFRWLGGTLTNFETIRKSIKKLEELEAQAGSQEFNKMTKKERLLIEKKINKLNKTLFGIRKQNRIPDVLFIVDIQEENTAVTEAKKMGIPTIGICDTTSDPYLVDWPIPANDDSEKSIEMIVNLVAEAINEGKKEVKSKNTEDKSVKDNGEKK